MFALRTCVYVYIYIYTYLHMHTYMYISHTYVYPFVVISMYTTSGKAWGFTNHIGIVPEGREPIRRPCHLQAVLVTTSGVMP